MKLRINRALVLSLCLMVTISALSQTRNNSPYSIYGIGTVNDISNPISFSMGGVGIAFQNQAALNPTNPASFASLKEKSFVFDAGLVMNSSNLRSANLNEKASYATINHLLFGFQLANYWKISFGLIPFSDVGYGINMYEQRDDIGEEVNHIFNGEGGLSKAYISNAFNITDKLSVGVETGLFYGQIEKSYLQLFTDASYYFYTKESELNDYKDFYWKLGIQYNTNISENVKMTLGAIFSTNTKVDTKSMMLTQLVQRPIGGYTAVIDTISSRSTQGNTVIPGVLGLGVMLQIKDQFKFGLDIEKQFWSNHTALGVDAGMKNSTRIAIGGEYIPDIYNVFSYFKRIRYRAGIRYEKTPIYANGTQVSEIGISFGMGLPLRKTLSTINIGVEIGQLGKTSNNLIKDTFVKFKLGVSMHQIWFVQRKYD